MASHEQAPEIFDRRRRRRVQDRAAALRTRGSDGDFLYRHMADELIERLQWVTREFSDALLIGQQSSYLAEMLAKMGVRCSFASPGMAESRMSGGVQCDEDRLPFADASFDLVVACGGFDTVNDLPGALVLLRRVLRPDGLLLAAMFGAGTLPRLKRAMLVADGERVQPRIHPQIDVRTMGDLLARAGFAMPVADGEGLSVRYPSLPGLVRDLRGMGATNVLTDTSLPLDRPALVRAAEAFARDAAPDGKVEERFEFVYLSGWAPAPGQPKPAPRGSGTASLAQALKRKS